MMSLFFFLIDAHGVIHQVFFIRDIVLIRRYGFFAVRLAFFGIVLFSFFFVIPIISIQLQSAAIRTCKQQDLFYVSLFSLPFPMS